VPTATLQAAAAAAAAVWATPVREKEQASMALSMRPAQQRAEATRLEPEVAAEMHWHSRGANDAARLRKV
jgi:hypothetical protein